MMKRTTIYNKVLVVAILALSLSACVKDHLYAWGDEEEQPEQPVYPDEPTEPEQPEETSKGGVVAVEINLPDGTANSDFTVNLESTPLGLAADGKFYSGLLDAGDYGILGYNVPEGFTVTDGIAYVDKVDGETGKILPNPGVLYSATETATVVDNDTTEVYLDVEQRTRDLIILLTVVEGDPSRIVSITSTLSGIAGAYDLVNETLYGDPYSVDVNFTVNGYEVTDQLRLLGVLGEQTLTLHIVFSNGDTMDIESDVTEALATFNDGKDPFILTGNLHLPVEAGFTGSITEWEQADGDNVDAH